MFAGTLTSGSLSLTSAHVVQLGPRSCNSTESSQAAGTQPELQKLDLSSSDHHSQLSGHASLEQGRLAVSYAVALSRAANHPISRAMVAYGDRSNSTTYGSDSRQAQVDVRNFEQVAGQGVQGICSMVTGADQNPGQSNATGPSAKVYFGSVDFITSVLPAGVKRQQMTELVRQMRNYSTY